MMTENRPTPHELAMDDDTEELQRRCKAELSPEHFELAAAWAFAADSSAGAYHTRHAVRVAVDVAKHFPGMEPAIRLAFEHVEDSRGRWPACCDWPAVDGEEAAS